MLELIVQENGGNTRRVFREQGEVLGEVERVLKGRGRQRVRVRIEVTECQGPRVHT